MIEEQLKLHNKLSQYGVSSVYDLDCHSLNELIYHALNNDKALYDFIIEELAKKTDLYGDHKGSWQGLDKPTLSEEGAHAQVEKNMADIIDIKTSLDNNMNTISNNITNIEIKKQYNNVPTTTCTVSFVDDDGLKEVNTLLKPLFNKYGVKFTSCVNTSKIGNDNAFMTWEEVKSLYEDGFNIESHGHEYNKRLGSCTLEEQLTEFKKSKEMLLNNGIYANHFIYQQGDYNDTTLENIGRFYMSAVATKLSAEQSGLVPPLKTFKISRIGLGTWQDKTTQEIKDIILQAKEENRWVVFMTHCGHYTEQPSEGNLQAIEDIIKFCQANGVNIETYDKAYRRYMNKMEIGNNSITNKSYYIMGADYKMYSNVPWLNDVTNISLIPLTGLELPSYFKLNTITHKEISGVNAGNMPEQRAGLYTVERVGTSLGYTKATYKPHQKSYYYVRTGMDNDIWSEWQKIGV